MTGRPTMTEPMSAAEFRQLLAAIERTPASAGDALGCSVRQCFRYAAGDSPVLGPVARLLRLLSSCRIAWTRVPRQYHGRWVYEYDDKNSTFFVCCNGYRILDSEDSEVCDAVCRAFNAWFTLEW
jgi:hypothetical protein